MVLPPIKNPFEANPIVNNVTPPIVNNVTPPIVNNVTPPIVNNVTPPIVNNVTPPTDTPPIVNNVTPPTDTPPIVNNVTPPTDTPPTDSEMTFPLLMKFITGNNQKLTSETVNQVLNENGIKSLPLLFSRPDLLPQIHAELVKLL
jgi:hypothetical protein